jgi:hypothetical protein
MKNKKTNLVTHSIQINQKDTFVSIGYISSFIGLCNMQLHTLLKGANYIYRGKRKLYPFGETILYLIEHKNFKYSKYLTSNGTKIKQLQKGLK